MAREAVGPALSVAAAAVMPRAARKGKTWAARLPHHAAMNLVMEIGKVFFFLEITLYLENSNTKVQVPVTTESLGVVSARTQGLGSRTQKPECALGVFLRS